MVCSIRQHDSKPGRCINEAHGRKVSKENRRKDAKRAAAHARFSEGSATPHARTRPHRLCGQMHPRRKCPKGDHPRGLPTAPKRPTKAELNHAPDWAVDAYRKSLKPAGAPGNPFRAPKDTPPTK